MLRKLVSSFYSMTVFDYSKYIHVLYCMLSEIFLVGEKFFKLKQQTLFFTCVIYVCGVCMCVCV